MNQKNGKNSLGLDASFGEHDNPIDLFKNWFDKAKESEINDPNAVALGTVDEKKQPSVRMVLLKGLSNEGFVFYTNFNSKKGSDLKKNHFASMCFHWKSLRRQVRVIGKTKQVSDAEADEYFNSRPYGNRIAAWASSQSQPMENRNMFLNKIDEIKKKYSNQKNVPRPPHWSGWRIHPKEIEFWIDGESRVHERLNYILKESSWVKEILYP
jgi:pyridoxamine 5'-phosphate oxidase